MDQDRLKQQVAEAAIERVASHPDDQLVLGIGTGSTAEWFIKVLERILAMRRSKKQPPVRGRRPAVSWQQSKFKKTSPPIGAVAASGGGGSSFGVDGGTIDFDAGGLEFTVYNESTMKEKGKH